MTAHTIVRKIISILVITRLIGCTSLRPIEATPDALQARIRQDDIAKVGTESEASPKTRRNIDFW